MDQDATWYGRTVSLGPGNIESDGDTAPPAKKGAQHPHFWPMYCCQTAAWIKMSLGTGVGLGPGHIVIITVITLLVNHGNLMEYDKRPGI